MNKIFLSMLSSIVLGFLTLYLEIFLFKEFVGLGVMVSVAAMGGQVMYYHEKSNKELIEKIKKQLKYQNDDN